MPVGVGVPQRQHARALGPVVEHQRRTGGRDRDLPRRGEASGPGESAERGAVARGLERIAVQSRRGAGAPREREREGKREVGHRRRPFSSHRRLANSIRIELRLLQMKMKEVEGGEKHHMQSLIGQKIVSPDGDFTGGELLKDDKHSFFYDAESYLNFGHPEKKGLAAMQTRDDLFDVDHKKMKQDVHDQMKELTEEQI